MKNIEVFSLYEGLYEISQNKDLKLNIKVCYVLAKNKNNIQPLYNAIIETRQRLLDKYGEAKDDGEWNIPKEKLNEFMKQWNDFMDVDNFVVLQKVKLSDLDEEQVGIELMEKLLPIIEE